MIEANPAPAYADEADIYYTTPYMSAPYDPGSLKSSALEAALNAVKQVRYAAGLDADIELSQSYSSACQAGALVNAVNSQLSHTPYQPSGMPEDLYALGYKGSSHSNIAMGYMALSYAVFDGWMYDGDSGNIDAMGHRRWILNPTMGVTGFGQVGAYTQMYALDTSFTGVDHSYVVWPAQQMPFCWMSDDLPWTVSCGETINADSVRVSLYRHRDGRSWSFSSSNSEDGYFNVNNENYGQIGCVIFRPNDLNPMPGDLYDVSVTGIGGTLQYSVQLFTLVNSTEKSGKTGNLNWKITTDNRLVITGKGAMPDYETFKDAPWIQYKDYISEIEVGEGVTTVGTYAFYDMSVTSVKLPTSLRDIHMLAFGRCNALTEIHLPKGLENMDSYAFSYCDNLKAAYIPTTVQNFAYAFEASGLTDILFPGTEAQFSGINYSYYTLSNVNIHYNWEPPQPNLQGVAVLDTGEAIGGFWVGAPYALKYRVQRQPKGGSWQNALTTTETGFSDSEAVVGTYYTYRVQAFDITAGWKSYSNKISLWYNPFWDVSEFSSYLSSVMWATRNGITSGTSKTTFSPNKECARYQFAVMLYKYAGKPAVSGKMPFTDIKKTASYYNAVLWAYTNGIISGTSKTTFSPNDPVKRYQVVQMLYKYAGKPKVNTTVNPFEDVSKSNSYYNAVLWAVENNITKGTSATKFSPDEECLRYQMVVFLNKYSKNIDGRND